MPVTLVTAPSAPALWDTMSSRFLDELGDNPGPDGLQAHLWLRDRYQRDLLLEAAYARGSRGWLGTPFTFWNGLAAQFDIRARPIGLLTRRALISRLGRDAAERAGFTDPRRGSVVVRGHMLDGIFSDLLPEGIGPDELEQALSALDTDDFGERRNAWVLETYRAYLTELDRLERVDPRSVPALLADAIGEGALSDATRGAGRLHVYGLLYDLRSRRRLVQALHEQPDVRVDIYAVVDPDAHDFDAHWRSMGVELETIAGDPAPAVRVQPAPTASVEAAWVAAQIKGALVDGSCRPHEIAVIARSGRDDTHRVADALHAAGVPVTVRARRPLAEIGALKAFLSIFRGGAEGWTYRALRTVVMSPYFNTGIRARTLDHLAEARRIRGLSDWSTAVRELLTTFGKDPKSIWGTGLFEDHLEEDVKALNSLGESYAWLARSRSERDWVDRTLELLRSGPFKMRGRASAPVGDDWETVRFDQRGVLQLERLLREWLDVANADDTVEPAEWATLFERLMAGSELALSTPMDQGVQVVEAQDAALTPYRRTFVVHANHGEFPREPRAGGVLTDGERRVLADAGLPVLHRDDDLARERRLWKSVTSGADVTALYRTTSHTGTPLMPSLTVPEHDVESELPRTRLPSWDPVSLSEVHVDACTALRMGAASARLVPVADAARVRRAVLAAVAESHRAGTEDVPEEHPGLHPNPWNGQLADPEVLERIAEKFGPERVWSASQLESYGACPFVFLIERVLGISERGEADEETTPLTFGGVAHDVLERFYGQLLTSRGRTWDPATVALLNDTVEQVVQARQASGEWMGNPVLWENTKEQIRETLHAYVAWELGYLADKGEWPVAVELAFGFEEDSAVELAGHDLTGAPGRLALRGKIDRVDRAGVGDDVVHRVLDYKSSSIPSKSGYSDGSVLQAALYLEAIATLGYRPDKGRYRALKKPNKPKNGAEVVVGHAQYERALKHAFSIVNRIRQGLFEPVMAPSQQWKNWHPGAEITRSRAKLPRDGGRFDE